MKSKFGFVTILILTASAFLGSVALADTEKASFDYHIGDGFAVLNNTGNTAVAENGDTVNVRGTGTFDVVSKTASGGGTFTHKRADGTTVATGTWTATGLLAFQSYGPGTPQGTPPNFFGGRAALAIVGTPTGSTMLPGILEIECALGTPPGGAEEGVRLLVKGIINFNKSVHESGENVFVMH